MGAGDIFIEKFKSGCRDPIFLWWELLPNLPGIQSLKALLLFVKGQCQFLPPLHHHQLCFLIPLLENLG